MVYDLTSEIKQCGFDSELCFFYNVGPWVSSLLLYASCETGMILTMYLFHGVFMRTEYTVFEHLGIIVNTEWMLHMSSKTQKIKTSHKQIRNNLE